MVDRQKRYVGSYVDEEEAAKKYDIAAIQNHRERAKTNFFYEENELNCIKSQEPILGLSKDSSIGKKCTCYKSGDSM